MHRDIVYMRSFRFSAFGNFLYRLVSALHLRSHHIYGRGRQRVSIPRQKPTMKPAYVRTVLELTQEE